MNLKTDELYRNQRNQLRKYIIKDNFNIVIKRSMKKDSKGTAQLFEVKILLLLFN